MESRTRPAAAVGSTAGAAVYERLRADLVFGRIAPGQKLRLDALRQSYGVAIGTLREIAQPAGGRGAGAGRGAARLRGAAGQCPRARASLPTCRLLLERHAMAQSFAAGDVEWEGRVVAAHHKLEVIEARMIAGHRDEAPAWKRYDGEFHHALISACGSETLMQAHANGFDRYLRYLMVAACFRGAVAADEHRRLRDCALARDAEGAGRVLAEHIGGCVEQVLARMR